MFRRLKERLTLKRRLRQINEEYLEQLTGSIHYDELDKSGSELLSDRQNILIELEVLEAEKLERAAGRYGIERLPPHEIYRPKLKGPDPSRYYSQPQKAQLIKMIAEAKYNWWKRWVDLFVPILALLIALLAFLKDIIIAWLVQR